MDIAISSSLFIFESSFLIFESSFLEGTPSLGNLSLVLSILSSLVIPLINDNEFFLIFSFRFTLKSSTAFYFYF